MEQGGKPRGGQLVGQDEEGGGGEGEEEKKSGALRGLAGRRTDHAGLGSRRYQVSLALEPLTLFDPGGGQIFPHPAQTRIPVKNRWAENLIILYIPKYMLRTLETTFHGKKTFCLVRNSFFSLVSY